MYIKVFKYNRFLFDFLVLVSWLYLYLFFLKVLFVLCFVSFPFWGSAPLRRGPRPLHSRSVHCFRELLSAPPAGPFPVFHSFLIRAFSDFCKKLSCYGSLLSVLHFSCFTISSLVEPLARSRTGVDEGPREPEAVPSEASSAEPARETARAPLLL